MQLTDEQYNQIARYVDGQMDEGESAAFDAARAVNDELNDEIEIYREIQSLGQSIVQKLNNQSFTKQENVGASDDVWQIKQARENWEQNKENELKLKLGLSAIEPQNTGDYNENLNKHNTTEGKVIKTNYKKWLIAAAILCVLLLSVLYWWRSNLNNTNIDVAKANDNEKSKPIIVDSSTNTQASKMPVVKHETLSFKNDTAVVAHVIKDNTNVIHPPAIQPETTTKPSFHKNSVANNRVVRQEFKALPNGTNKNIQQSIVQADTTISSAQRDSINNQKYLAMKKIASESAQSAYTEKKMVEFAKSEEKNQSEAQVAEKLQLIENTRSRKESEAREKFKIDTATQTALFIANFKPDTTPTQIASRLRQAIAYYKNSDYKNAVTAFNNSHKFITRGFEENTPTEFYTKYYSGLSYLAIDSAKAAIENLEDAMAISPNNTLKAKTHWYLALAFLKARNVTAAKQALGLVINNEDAINLKQKATDLLKQLQ